MFWLVLYLKKNFLFIQVLIAKKPLQSFIYKKNPENPINIEKKNKTKKLFHSNRKGRKV